MVSPKIQAVCTRINMLIGNCFKTILRWIMVHQKVSKSYFQSQFFMSKIYRIFLKENSFKNINLGDHFCKKTIFEPLHFFKPCPIFKELVHPVFSKYNGFLWAYSFLAKNLAYKDPPFLKFQNRNWYYCLLK